MQASVISLLVFTHTHRKHHTLGRQDIKKKVTLLPILKSYYFIIWSLHVTEFSFTLVFFFHWKTSGKGCRLVRFAVSHQNCFFWVPCPWTPKEVLILDCQCNLLDPHRLTDPWLTQPSAPHPPPQQGCWPLLPAGQPPWTPAGVLTINPFLPSLATAVLACWIETAAGQLQKTDCLNPRGYNLSCKHTFSNLGNKWKIG